MTTWYRTGFRAWGGHKIEPVEVERSTDGSVWIKGKRHPRVATWDSYFETWEAAHEYLMREAEKLLDRERQSLKHAQDVYGNIKGMRK